MATPSLRAVGTGNAYSGTNSTLAKPAGVVEGDLLLAILCADGANDPIPWATRIPAGWLIAEEDLATGGAFKTHGAVAYKVAGASEPSNYAFSFGAQSGTGIVVAYQGANTTTPINVSAKQENGSATTAHPLPSVTTTVGDCLAVAVYQHRNNNGVPYTEPSGWTERVDFKGATSNSNFGVADKVFASAGATGTTSATGNNADETWVAVIALAPVGAVNAAPTFPGPNIGNQTGTVGTPISFSVASKFSDTDTLTFSAIGTWPSGVTVSSAGLVNGTPTVAGTYATLNVRATDTIAQTVDSDVFIFTISAAGNTTAAGGTGTSTGSGTGGEASTSGGSNANAGGGTGTSTGSGSGGDASGLAGGTGAFTTDAMENNSGAGLLASISVSWTWYQGTIGTAPTSTTHGTGTTSVGGVLTVSGLPTGAGFLLARTADSTGVYYQPGTVV